MKKWLQFPLMLLLVVVLLCSCGKKESPVEDFQYEKVDGEITITGYIGSDFDIVIPSKIDNRPVTVIGKEAFYGYDLKTLVLPDSIKRIEESAFEECALLEAVELPDSINFIGYSAFRSCDSLSRITLPDNVEFDKRVSNTMNGGYYRIWSPFDSNTIVIVHEGSQTLQALEDNKKILDTYFFNAKSFYIEYIVE